MEAAGLCQLDMMLFYEVFDDRASSLLYPVNALRNFARMQVLATLLRLARRTSNRRQQRHPDIHRGAVRAGAHAAAVGD